MVLDGEDYVHLNEAVIKLMTKQPIPVGYRIHHIDGTGDCYPDNLQLVSSDVIEEARRLYHPEGVPIRWVEENGVAKYSPTTVRLNPELLDFLDGEAIRVGWSRAKVLEHYLLRGIESGAKPESVAKLLEGKKEAAP